MGRIFTCTDSSRKGKQTYEGFGWFDGKSKLIAIASDEGDEIVYSLDNKEAIEELERFYRSEHGTVPKIYLAELK